MAVGLQQIFLLEKHTLLRKIQLKLEQHTLIPKLFLHLSNILHFLPVTYNNFTT